MTPLFSKGYRQYFKSQWIQPLNHTSDDRVRWFFHKYNWSCKNLIDLLCTEYPGLKLLFNGYKTLNDPETVQEHALKVAKECLSQKDSFHFLQCSLFSDKEHMRKWMQCIAIFHDIAAPVTTSNEPCFTSIDILSTVMNRLGFEIEEIQLAQAIVETTHSFIHLVHKKCTPEEVFISLKERAITRRLPLQDVYALSALFFACKAPCSANLPRSLVIKQQNGLHAISHPGLTQVAALVTQEKPINFAADKTPKPIGLMLSYAWEKVDPKHHYGASLQKERDRYEHFLLQNPYWKWKGHFFEWLEEKGKGKTIGCVHFFTPDELVQKRIRVSKGKVVFPSSEQLKDLNTRMFVIGLDGIIYMAEKTYGNPQMGLPAYTHGSFASCGPVLSAGKILIQKDGTIQEITNHSGHYRPGAVETAYFLELLQKEGVSLKGIKLDLLIKTSEDTASLKTIGDAEKWLIQFQNGEYKEEFTSLAKKN